MHPKAYIFHYTVYVGLYFYFLSFSYARFWFVFFLEGTYYSTVMSVHPSINFNIFIFSRTTWLISAKLARKACLEKGDWSCSNDVSRPFWSGNNFEFVKMLWHVLKSFQEPLDPQTWHKSSLGKWDSAISYP